MQEHRDHYFGRLFGAEAIIKSAIIFQPSVPCAGWTHLVSLVFDLAKKKPWIREECGWIIYRCVYDLSAKQADGKFVQAALEQLSANDLVRTPEGISIWLACEDLFPSAMLPKFWKYDDPLDSSESGTLAKIMKESSLGQESNENEKHRNNNKSSGVWNPKLHFAWDAVLTRLSDGTKKEKSKSSRRLSFEDFWKEVVDGKDCHYSDQIEDKLTLLSDGLFASTSSEERKYWGFVLFVKVLNEGPLQQASLVFTKNLVRCVMNQLAVEDRYLHRMATKAAKSIHARVSRESGFAAAAVGGLMGPTGSPNFDQITKTKTVEKIVTEADADALSTIISLIEKLVQKPGTADAKSAASSRHVLAGLLIAIVRARAAAGTKDDDSARSLQKILDRIMLIFLRFGYFTDKDADKPTSAQPALIESTQELFRSRLSSCLNTLIANQTYAAVVPYTVVCNLRDAVKSGEFGKCIIGMDDTIRKSVKTAFKSLRRLSKEVSQSVVFLF